MEKIINSYESMLIVSLANGEEAAKATVGKFTDLITANAELVQSSPGPYATICAA